ncbi:uncharacterized protein MELLADRAFT_114226 [Melampsora larici-populina 98AG31]|uniref:Uncharacterized protein n=1 Tax=Melampsora larici-populina (strain 98AG31 / pathotype 3-4-7) TaxID=747676 RepID=F4SCP3_MELLP|nr:uncharacterized protein MELLADRAFT_114226 [Melampsora larici-populina 98AG31]EGF97579.1 hypothetical protein MELLADRAFT_114226 [Melampsora larici-populina 98AG31]
MPPKNRFPKDLSTDTKGMGVIKFNIERLQGLTDATGGIPSVNQIKGHPLTIQPELNNASECELKIVDYPEDVKQSRSVNSLVGVFWDSITFSPEKSKNFH